MTLITMGTLQTLTATFPVRPRPSPSDRDLPVFRQVLGRCFLTVMQVHFQFLSQALQKVQPVAQSCLAEALAQAQERRGGGGGAGRPHVSAAGSLNELEEASRSWKAAAEVRQRRRPGGSGAGCLSARGSLASDSVSH